MKYIKHSWHYFLAEPFIWIFYCFVQPSKFGEEADTENLSRRILLTCRMPFPIFLISCPVAFIVRLALYTTFHTSIANVSNFLLGTIWTSVLGIVIGIILGTMGGSASSIALGIVDGITGDMPFGILSTSASLIALDTASGVIGDPGRFIILSMTPGISISQEIAITLGAIDILVTGLFLGAVLGSRMSFRGGLFLCITLGLTGLFVGGPILTIIWDSAFIVGYILGYYRLPLYLLSFPFDFKAYLNSVKHPQEVFRYLHRSSLYWMENIFFPLPYLKSTLLIAVEQNQEQTRAEINFIRKEREHQLGAARAAFLEMTIHLLEIPDPRVVQRAKLK